MSGLNGDLTFDFKSSGNLSETSLGNYLRSAYSSYSSIPDSIAQQFNNPTELGSDIFPGSNSPRSSTAEGSRGENVPIPRQYITQVKKDDKPSEPNSNLSLEEPTGTPPQTGVTGSPSPVESKNRPQQAELNKQSQTSQPPSPHLSHQQLPSPTPSSQPSQLPSLPSLTGKISRPTQNVQSQLPHHTEYPKMSYAPSPRYDWQSEQHQEPPPSPYSREMAQQDNYMRYQQRTLPHHQPSPSYMAPQPDFHRPPQNMQHDFHNTHQVNSQYRPGPPGNGGMPKQQQQPHAGNMHHQQKATISHNPVYNLPQNIPQPTIPHSFSSSRPHGVTHSPGYQLDYQPQPRMNREPLSHQEHKEPSRLPVDYLVDQQHNQQYSDQPVSLAVQPLNNSNLSLVAANVNEEQYCDITEFLTMPQSQAAKKLQIPASTLSKRWKEAAPNRKWPWRTLCKIDKEITTLLHNIPPNDIIPPEIEAKLGKLIRQRQDELKPIVIRL